MKSATIVILNLILLITSPFISLNKIEAYELSSPNYKLTGVTTSGLGGVFESTNYQLLSTLGQISADPRNYSTNYRINQGPSEAFTAAQPTVQCFETDTSLPSGAIGLYNMNESSDGTCSGGGDVCDKSVLDNHFSSVSTNITDGYFDKGRSFDGAGSHLTISSMDTSSATDALTVSFWSNTNSEVFIQTLISDQAQSNDVGYIWLYRTSTAITLQCATEIGQSRASATWSGYFDNNTWIHTTIVIDYANNTAKLYKNGNPFGATHNSAYDMQFPITPRRKNIGAYSTTGAHPLKGKLDEFIIYNEALTDKKVLERYNRQLPTSCMTGPGELSNNGMVALCGGTGCYNKARFEIEPYVNPTDTLYGIEISTDNFASDIKCIDGSTFYPKTFSTCDINDFRTETYWENEVFNIKNLELGTTYYIRITALHGNFTQSDYSIIANTTTSTAHIFFDIDIATNTGYTTESSPPYSITFTGDSELIAGGAPSTAPTLIWLDAESSSEGGMAVIQFGENAGLYSLTTTEIISSTNLDLDTPGSEGFGLQSYYINYESSTYLGDITATTNYASSGNVVGEVSTTAQKIYDGDGPINTGRMGLYLKARAATNRTGAADYSELIYFVIVPRY